VFIEAKDNGGSGAIELLKL